jgi:hypothetical protein
MKHQNPTLAMLAVAALMAGVTVSPMAVPHANAQISIHLGWQDPPREYNDLQQQGFHAGIEAARHDLDHGMPPDPNRHSDFRHQREDFRRGFSQGYEVAYQHRGEWDPHHHDWGQPH